ncbi:MAG: hypothetical protein BWY14_00552 [Parcubacteria group bacterium ADurb.Bin192]|nr:MAG: hypothetical protein BWY14_00552 [Parcubacteria group bacterium ADurb.Bin192]
MNDSTIPFDILCDPITHKDLRLLDSGQLCTNDEQSYYPVIDGIPDLLPDAGSNSKEGALERAKNYNAGDKVRKHYDERPCHNYMDINNVPWGKYLRDSKYDYLFTNKDVVIEVGSGKGAIAEIWKKYRGITPICIDQALGSLRHVKRPPVEAPSAILGSNLALPIKDKCVDIIISHGVIHHTPNPMLCLVEFSRVIKTGGKLILAVYNWENFYRRLYWFMNCVCAAYRKIFGKKLGDILIMITIFPFYHLAIWFVLIFIQKKYQFPPIKESWEQFNDFFTTPIAKFYFKDEMQKMVESLGFKLLEYDAGGWPKGDFAHYYWFERE